MWKLMLVPLAALAFAGCEVRQEEKAEPPEVQVQPGRLPEYDVETGEPTIGTDTQRVITPDVDVRTESDTAGR
jgi:hypothetical protein